MSVDYKGQSCRYDKRTNTYSRSPVSIKFPCSTCGSNRPTLPGSLMPGICCPRPKVDNLKADALNRRQSNEI